MNGPVFWRQVTHSRHKFNEIEKTKAEKPECPPPFSLRLTYEERARLDAEQGDKSLAAYIRECLFGDDAAPRKRRGNSPVQDKEALGRVMGAFGQSRLSANLWRTTCVMIGMTPTTRRRASARRPAKKKAVSANAPHARTAGAGSSLSAKSSNVSTTRQPNESEIRKPNQK